MAKRKQNGTEWAILKREVMSWQVQFGIEEIRPVLLVDFFVHPNNDPASLRTLTGRSIFQIVLLCLGWLIKHFEVSRTKSHDFDLLLRCPVRLPGPIPVHVWSVIGLAYRFITFGDHLARMAFHYEQRWS